MSDIAIIGGGNIGEALIAGILGSGKDPRAIIVSDPSETRLEALKQSYGVVTTTDSVEAVSEATTAFLCVKPDVIAAVTEAIADTLDSNDQETTIVSVAAGVTIASIEAALPAGTPVVRVMPNTPMLVSKGAAGVAGGRFAEQRHVDLVVDIFQQVGTAVVVAEKDMDAVTAVSGSGPAYIFLVVEAMIDAGVQLGLPRSVAEELAIANLEGAAAMVVQGYRGPGKAAADGADKAGEAGEERADVAGRRIGVAELRANVMSPGGTTAAAIRSFEENGLRAAFYRAMQACKDRSIELGK